LTIGEPIEAVGALDLDRGPVTETRNRFGEDRPEIGWWQRPQFYFVAVCAKIADGATLRHMRQMARRNSRLIFVLRRVIPLLAALVIVETSAAQPQRPVSNSLSPGTSAISGVLIDAVTKQPVAGCMVVLNQLYVPRNPHAVTKTGEDGAYAFVGIPDAEYHVNTMCDSHLPACFRSEGAEPRRCDTVAVARDQQKSNIDVHLIKGAAARGKVIDATGRPIPGAAVKLGMPRFDARYEISAAAQTGRDGTFELNNLPSGGWLLEAELPQEPGALRPPIVYYPGVLLTGAASFIELVSGRTTDDVTIVAPRLADNKLTVRVVTLDHLTDLDVSFVRVEPLVSRKVTLDDSGTGTINGMTEGRYFLTARAHSGNRILAAHDTVDIIGGEQEILLYLQRASRIAGRIIGEKGAAPALDGVRVGASWMQDGVEVNPLDISEAQVAADGTFALEGLFGTSRLQLMGLDQEWEIRSIVQDRSDVTGSGVSLAADSEAKVVITLRRR
jgi:hypothetical protein